MKRLVISVLCSALLLYSCGSKKNEPVIPPDPAPESITVTPTSYDAAADGGRFTLSVTAPQRPVASADCRWIKITDGTYSNYSIPYPVTVDANETYSDRTGIITITSGGKSATVTISQAASEQPVIPDKPSIPTPSGNAAWRMSNALGLGWNMGNQMEAFDSSTGKAIEGCWTDGTLATQATFDGVKAKGFKSVRIPVTWMDHIGPALEYKLDERLDRVEELVEYAEKAGLNVIVNIHHDGAIDYTDGKYITRWLDIRAAMSDASVNERIKDEIKSVWTQIAERFKDKGDFLILESFNEIQDGHWGWSEDYKSAAGKKRQNDILNEWNQTFVDAVRATGGNNSTRWLGVPGYAADPGFTLYDGFVLPSDPAGKMMVAVHYYLPYHFCQTAEASEWGHTRKTNLGDSAFGEEYMQRLMSRLYDKYVANNIPVYIGEFGCANRVDARARQFQLYWLEYFSKCARSYGMSGFIWDNGAGGEGNEIYGIVHHGTGEYLDFEYGSKIVEACKKGFYTERSSYTLDSVYNTAP